MNIAATFGLTNYIITNLLSAEPSLENFSLTVLNVLALFYSTAADVTGDEMQKACLLFEMSVMRQ